MLPSTREAERARAEIQRVAPLLVQGRPKESLLEAIGWPLEVEERFFANHATKLPDVSYEVDKSGLDKQLKALSEIEKTIEPTKEGESLVSDWLRRTVRGQIDACRLLRAMGTAEFGERSRELYGSARSRFYQGQTTNLDFAEHLLDRLTMFGWDEAKDPAERPLSASQFALQLQERIDRRKPKLPVKVALDPKCSAKAIAGMRKVRVRPDASFRSWEADALYYHEVETHCLSAHNGASQPELSFLCTGGPRTTLTQEGIAVFSELYNRVLGIDRIERLAIRVKLVAMAENGASFLDLYRFLLDRGSAPREAYCDAQRVCRGGLVSGGAPFTKDACYLAGLLHVHAFLSVFVRAGLRDEMELILCGRLALDDIAALAELRSLGILQRPKHRPRWLRSWNTLLPYFAFSSFLESVDLAPVESHYRELLEVGRRAGPILRPSTMG